MIIHKKFTFVGDPWCGKTSIIHRFIRDEFKLNSGATVMDSYDCSVMVDGQRINLTVMDTAGDEVYEDVRPSCYWDTDLIILCFSFQDPQTLENIEQKWDHELKLYCRDVPIILVGNMSDLKKDTASILNILARNQRIIDTKHGRDMAEKIGAYMYLECSAKTGKGVDWVFQLGAKVALQPNKRRRSVDLKKEKDKKKKKKKRMRVRGRRNTGQRRNINCVVQ